MLEVTRLNLLTINSSITDAETYADAIQKHGIIVHHQQIVSASELLDAIKKGNWDLIIYGADASAITTEKLFETLSEVRQPPPVIVVVKKYSRADAMTYLSNGAIDVVALDELNYLADPVIREVENTENIKRIRQLERERDHCDERFYRLAEYMRQAVAYVHEGIIVYANPMFMDLFALDDSDGLSLLELTDGEHQTKLKDLLSSEHAEQNALVERHSLPFVNTEGKPMNLGFQVSPCVYGGESCLQILFDSPAAPATAQRSVALTLENTSSTGAIFVDKQINTELFFTELTHCIDAVQSNKPEQWLCLVELDDFSSLKETLGLAACDNVLKDIVRFISSLLNPGSLFTRLGGDAFAILLRDTDDEAAHMLVEKLRLSIAKHVVKTGKHAVSLTCSMGIAAIDDAQLTQDQLLAYADTARGLARSKGGNHAHFFDPWKDQVALSENIEDDWSLRIENALRYNSFALLYQPIVSAEGDTQPRYEILLRLLTSDNAEIMPDQFLHAAHKAGLEQRIDRWVISHALKQTRLAGNQRNTYLFIKLSDETVLDTQFADWLKKEVRLEGSLAHLVFEVNASLCLTNEAQLRAFLTNIQSLGIEVAAEHVGKEKATLTALQQLKFDYIKLDARLTLHLGNNRENQVAVSHIIEMAKKNNIPTIATAVQDAGSLAILWQDGANFIQGYYIQPPLYQMDYDFTVDTAV